VVKTLQRTSNEDFQFLCKAITIEGLQEEKLLFFYYHFRGAKDPISNTLVFMGHLTKQRVGLQNALR
jgi:hypothetical protein